MVVGHDHPPLNEAGEQAIGFADLAKLRWITYPTYMPMSALLERELDFAGLPMPANPILTASPLVTVILL